MRFLSVLICMLLTATTVAAQYDMVIVGGNPGGIMAAISGAREGKTSVILERTGHIGGLPANGLGATDIETRAATTGLFKEFVDRIRDHYVKTYGEGSQQVKDCSDGYHFEPSVGALVFEQMLGEVSDKVTVLTMRQFDSDPANLTMHNDRITELVVTNRVTGEKESYSGKIFLDATYEGDLGAAAGVPFRVGREGYDEFKEPGAGRLYMYWRGETGEGSTRQGDNAVQAYNYRLCLTNDPANRLKIEKPANYNREEFASLAEDVWTGLNANRPVTAEMMEKNREHLRQGNASTTVAGDNWGIAKITNRIVLPNGKTDANNQHGALISTDLPEENWPWPTSDWEWRDKYAQRLKDYTLGLLWFAQNDKELPEQFRKATQQWGLAKDEYTDNGNFPRQVYVREGRRFEGVYFFTANDALAVIPGERPPLHNTSITSSHYSLDSHAVRKRETGRVHLDGFFGIRTQVYTVPYGVIVPKKVDNLLLPVPVSGSHIGFSTLRMEPCWMAMGQAAGIASSLAIDTDSKVQNVCMDCLQRKLVEQKATLIYFRDITIDSPDFAMVQLMAMKGYLPGWEARLNDPVDAATLAEWNKLSGKPLNATAGQTLRGDALRNIYNTK